MSGVGMMTALRRVRVWLGQALLVAFLLKALIPAGFMPEFSGGDAFKIVICTANGTKLVDADAESGDPSRPAPTHMGEPCTIGGLAAVLAPDALVTIVFQGELNAAVGPGPLAVVLPPARAGPAHSPRAPPFLV
jgi:hypothetical protein